MFEHVNLIYRCLKVDEEDHRAAKFIIMSQSVDLEILRPQEEMR